MGFELAQHLGQGAVLLDEEVGVVLQHDTQLLVDQVLLLVEAVAGAQEGVLQAAHVPQLRQELRLHIFQLVHHRSVVEVERELQVT